MALLPHGGDDGGVLNGLAQRVVWAWDASVDADEGAKTFGVSM